LIATNFAIFDTTVLFSYSLIENKWSK